MEEADAYNDCSWGAFDYEKEGSEGEGEDVDQDNQEQEAEADSHRPSTLRCIMVSNQSHNCPVVNMLCNQGRIYVFNNNFFSQMRCEAC